MDRNSETRHADADADAGAERCACAGKARKKRQLVITIRAVEAGPDPIASCFGGPVDRPALIRRLWRLACGRAGAAAGDWRTSHGPSHGTLLRVRFPASHHRLEF